MVNAAELTKRAREVLNPRQLSACAEVGGVASALVTDKGNIYVGVCIDASSGMGFCAEHSAIAAMVTAGENKIISIAAVDWDGKVIAPCGRCREFIFQINGNSGDVDIILHDERVVKLDKLLPEHWFEGKSCMVESTI